MGIQSDIKHEPTQQQPQLQSTQTQALLQSSGHHNHHEHQHQQPISPPQSSPSQHKSQSQPLAESPFPLPPLYATPPFTSTLTHIPSPADAKSPTTMTAVRIGVDTLDQAIVTLLGTRLRYIEAAAGIKPDRGVVRDESRKQDVINKAKRRATEVGFPEELVGRLYEILVEASISHEFVTWDGLRMGGGEVASDEAEWYNTKVDN